MAFPVLANLAEHSKEYLTTDSKRIKLKHYQEEPFVPLECYLPQNPFLHELQLKSNRLGYGKLYLEVMYIAPHSTVTSDKNWPWYAAQFRVTIQLIDFCVQLSSVGRPGEPLGKCIVYVVAWLNRHFDAGSMPKQRATFNEQAVVYDERSEWDQSDAEPVLIDSYLMSKEYLNVTASTVCPTFDCFNYINSDINPRLDQSLHHFYNQLYKFGQHATAPYMYNTQRLRELNPYPAFMDDMSIRERKIYRVLVDQNHPWHTVYTHEGI